MKCVKCVSGKYSDIINLPHHQSAVRPHMPVHDRAAQFAPCAALTGYEDIIKKSAAQAVGEENDESRAYENEAD